MKSFAILLLMLCATTSYAVPYDLSSDKAELAKQISNQTQINTELNKQANFSLPKIENQPTIIGTDLLDLGKLKVTKKICVHAEGSEITADAFSYDVNIGIKVIFI